VISLRKFIPGLTFAPLLSFSFAIETMPEQDLPRFAHGWFAR